MNISDLIEAIDSGAAKEITDASFAQGDEMELVSRFFRLNGNIFQYRYNKRSTCSDFSWIRGENLDLMNAYYPEV